MFTRDKLHNIIERKRGKEAWLLLLNMGTVLFQQQQTRLQSYYTATGLDR